MKPSVWVFLDTETKTMQFRGYVKVREGDKVVRHPCPRVRLNKSTALKDAERLMKKLQHA